MAREGGAVTREPERAAVSCGHGPSKAQGGCRVLLQTTWATPTSAKIVP